MTIEQADTSTESTEQIQSNSFSGDYEHHRRVAVPGPDFAQPGVRLKWYEIHRPDVAIPAKLGDESRCYVKAEIEAGRLDIASELGFGMLHLGDERSSRNTFVMLFVCTWRNGNELWRTLFTKSLNTDREFELFHESGHIGAFCVWELGVVLHEREAWNRFLYSNRDESAREAYLLDKYEGPV